MTNQQLQLFSEKRPISARVNGLNVLFLEQLAERRHTTVSEQLEKAINWYRKFILWQDFQEGFSEQTQEDVRDAMSDFEDYLSMIQHEENSPPVTI